MDEIICPKNSSPSWFSSLERIWGTKAVMEFQKAKVLVVGLGGVGSWAAEALVRSGIGSLALMDLDEVCVSNINRQIQALESTVGQSKIVVLGKRFSDINPRIHLELISDFFTKENALEVFPRDVDLVIDAIDGLTPKCALSALCKEQGIPLVVCGGVGGIRSPLSLRVDDLAFALRDQLLYRMRKKLRSDFGFPEGKKKGRGKKFGIKAVFADSDRVFYDGKGGVGPEAPEDQKGESSKMDCFQGLGSNVMVTSSMGMIAAQVGLEILLEKKLNGEEENN